MSVFFSTAEEMTYDAMTPDSGVHENFTNLTAEEQEKQREEWTAELTKVVYGVVVDCSMVVMFDFFFLMH